MWLRFKKWFMSKVKSMIVDYAELMGVYSWGVYGGSRIYSTSEYDGERDSGEDSRDIGGYDIGLGGRLHKFVYRRYLNKWASDSEYLSVVMDILRDSFSQCFKGVRVYGYYKVRLIYVVNRIWLEHGDFRFLGFISLCFRFYWALFFYHISRGWAVSFRQLCSHISTVLDSRTYFVRMRLIDFLNRVLVSSAGVCLSRFVRFRSEGGIGNYGLFHFDLGCDDGIYTYWYFAGFFAVFCRLYDENDDLGSIRFKGWGLCHSRLDLFRHVRRFVRGDFGLRFF